MLGRRAVVLGVGLLALFVCVSVRLLSGSAPVLLAGEVAGGAGGGGLLSKELAQDARMLATLSGPPGLRRIAQAGWGGEAAKHGSAAHTRERHEMMSRYGAVPASWCAPVRPPLLRMHSCTHLAGTSACTVGSADIGIQLGTFLRVWRAHH